MTDGCFRSWWCREWSPVGPTTTPVSEVLHLHEINTVRHTSYTPVKPVRTSDWHRGVKGSRNRLLARTPRGNVVPHSLDLFQLLGLCFRRKRLRLLRNRDPGCRCPNSDICLWTPSNRSRMSGRVNKWRIQRLWLTVRTMGDPRRFPSPVWRSRMVTYWNWSNVFSENSDRGVDIYPIISINRISH